MNPETLDFTGVLGFLFFEVIKLLLIRKTDFLIKGFLSFNVFCDK